MFINSEKFCGIFLLTFLVFGCQKSSPETEGVASKQPSRGPQYENQTGQRDVYRPGNSNSQNGNYGSGTYWTDSSGIYSQQNYNQPYNNQIKIDSLNPSSPMPMGRQDVAFAVPVSTAEIAEVANEEAEWTWKMVLDYQDDANDKTESGDLEIMNGKASIVIKAVPVGTVGLLMEISRNGTLIYKGEGTATVLAGQSSDAVIKMTKVNDSGDINVKPEFDEKDTLPDSPPKPDSAPDSTPDSIPDGSPQQEDKLSEEFRGWDGLSHKSPTTYIIQE